MKAPPFGLLEHLETAQGVADHNLAQSNLPPVDVEIEGLLGETDLSATYPGGSEALRRRIARRHGVGLERVLVTAGTSEANLVVALALVGPGSRVVVEMPYYEPLSHIYTLLGARLSYLPRTFEASFRLPLDSLDRLLPSDTSLLVLTNLYNPGGTALSVKELQEVGELAEERDFHILVDEIYRGAAQNGRLPSAAGLGDRFLVTSGLSKVYGLGSLRIGWCVASEPLLEQIRRVEHLASVAPSTLGDVLARRVLDRHEEVVARNRRLIQENRKQVAAWIEEQDRVAWVPPDAHVSFPRFEGDVERLAARALQKHGTLIAPGRFFGAPAHFRLCFGMASAEVAAGLTGLTHAIREV